MFKFGFIHLGQTAVAKELFNNTKTRPARFMAMEN